jgi:hypothetical protein
MRIISSAASSAPTAKENEVELIEVFLQRNMANITNFH